MVTSGRSMRMQPPYARWESRYSSLRTGGTSSRRRSQSLRPTSWRRGRCATLPTFTAPRSSAVTTGTSRPWAPPAAYCTSTRLAPLRISLRSWSTRGRCSHPPGQTRSSASAPRRPSRASRMATRRPPGKRPLRRAFRRQSGRRRPTCPWSTRSSLRRTSSTSCAATSVARSSRRGGMRGCGRSESRLRRDRRTPKPERRSW
mmetsp:Transcript_22606/g.74946  ORF Transcript_22606/g.74946 Transcript_22606/m.74946 type:complete len:202 (-) Transcript_22606:1994-2599(-)